MLSCLLRLNHKNIESLDLSTSSIILRRSYNVTVAANAFSATLESDVDLTLEPFDEEDYTLTYVGGDVEPLTRQKIALSGRTIGLTNLTQKWFCYFYCHLQESKCY